MTLAKCSLMWANIVAAMEAGTSSTKHLKLNKAIAYQLLAFVDMLS